MSKEASNDSLEESIFKTLSHQIRRDIVRVIGEQKEATFTEIKNQVKAEDSASLSYHLNTLQQLVTQKEGKYSLSDLGEEAYNLICKATTYTSSNAIISFLRKQLVSLIIANAVLWMIAILVTRQFEGTLNRTTVFTLTALWLVSNGIIYAILRGTGKPSQCKKIISP